MRHMVSKAVTVQYPDEIAPLPPRSRGVIALKEENCTMCMLCARECPDWCIYIEGHKERRESKGEGKRAKAFNVLDRFAIDYALCMYCGICVEVCPYDALFWSPEFEYAEGDITRLTHEMDRLEDWMRTVLPPSPLEEGARGPELKAAAPVAAAPPPAAEAPPAAPAAASPAPVATEPGPARPAGMSEAEYVEQRAAAGRLVRQKVFEEEIAKGSDPRVAEARAKAAEMRRRPRRHRCPNQNQPRRRPRPPPGRLPACRTPRQRRSGRGCTRRKWPRGRTPGSPRPGPRPRSCGPGRAQRAPAARRRGFASFFTTPGVSGRKGWVGVQQVVFGIVAALIVFAAVRLVTTRNLVHGALYLLAVLAGAAILFLLFLAEFVAWVQVLVYIGAVVVLLLFGLMLTRAPIGNMALDSQTRPLAAVVSLAIFAITSTIVWKTFKGQRVHFSQPGTISTLGQAIFSRYVLPFEIVSVVLLAALVGAVVLARKEE